MRSLQAVAVCTALSISALASAAEGGKPRQIAADLTAALSGTDPVKIGAAIDALGARGDRKSLAALVAFVRAGQPDALTDRALRALGERGSQDALPVLAEFIHHRRTSARIAAFAGIAGIPGRAADELLAQGLRDSATTVRALSARSLAERGASQQLEILFRAFARGVPDAAHAVGKLASAADIERFEAQLGRLPIGVMLMGYEQFLLRPDLDQAHKLDLIARLGEVASPTVKHFLEQLLASHDWSKQPRLRHALSETARRIDGRPRARSEADESAAGSSTAAPEATTAPADATAAETSP